MMYPLMTLNDETEIVHSQMLEDGRVKVYIERPDEEYCFRHATCWLPKYLWEDVYHFNEEEIRQFEEIIRSKESVILGSAWEHQRSKYSVLDIDTKVFSQYLKRVRNAGRINLDNEDPSAVMMRLGLSDDGQLLNAGAALFVDSEINELHITRYATDLGLTVTDSCEATGSILGLYKKTVEYIIDAMDWRVEFDGSLERKEIPEIPVVAIKEAVINAFAHRKIEVGRSVKVVIYRSYMEIYSPGKFPKEATPEMFINEIREPIYQNPLIAKALYYSGDKDCSATGLKRIQDACNEAGCKVEFYEEENGFTVRFYRHCGKEWGWMTNGKY